MYLEENVWLPYWLLYSYNRFKTKNNNTKAKKSMINKPKQSFPYQKKVIGFDAQI